MAVGCDQCCIIQGLYRVLGEPRETHLTGALDDLMRGHQQGRCGGHSR